MVQPLERELDLNPFYVILTQFYAKAGASKSGLFETFKMEIASEEIQIFSCVACCGFVDDFLQRR